MTQQLVQEYQEVFTALYPGVAAPKIDSFGGGNSTWYQVEGSKIAISKSKLRAMCDSLRHQLERSAQPDPCVMPALPQQVARVSGDSGVYKVWGYDWMRESVLVGRTSGLEWMPVTEVTLEDAQAVPASRLLMEPITGNVDTEERWRQVMAHWGEPKAALFDGLREVVHGADGGWIEVQAGDQPEVTHAAAD
ncbi:hypothetical protein [Geopseudomonas aromaticivorans]